MSDRHIQKFGHKVSPYARPNQKWQCGKTPQCCEGPDKHGQCSAVDQPCLPVRSVRYKKYLATIWLVAVFFGVLAVLLSSQYLLTIFSPGPLSISHAEVAECQDCHQAASKPLSQWMHEAFTSSDRNDNQQCLQCHKLGEHAFAAHSADPLSLSKRHLSPGTDSPSLNVILASELNTLAQPQGKSISCASCHREHKGNVSPSVMFDTQKCHTCHQQKFEKQHPEYTDYPNSQATAIIFDHASHLKKHFSDKAYAEVAPTACTDCHNTDSSGEWMLLKGFTNSCRSCHINEILGSNRAGTKGIAVLTVPELDVQSIEQAGFYLGYWPKWADGEITPMMELLLQTESPNTSVGLKNTHLYDLSEASPETLRDAAILAWNIKTLFYDIQTSGRKVLNERLSTAFNKEVDAEVLQKLVGYLPRDILINNQQEWFPNLDIEIAQYRAGRLTINGMSGVHLENTQTQSKKPTLEKNSEADNSELDSTILDDELLSEEGDLSTDEDELLNEDDTEDDSSSKDKDVMENEEWMDSGGWYRDGSSIRYMPNDHGDLFFKSWLDVSSGRSGVSERKIFSALTKDGSVGRCVKCHSIADSDKQKKHQAIHWKSFNPNDITVGFNRFSHVSHFGFMPEEGCLSCHKLNLTKVSAATDSQSRVSSFLSMPSTTCTQCHQEGRAPADCLICHKYHVEKKSRSIENYRWDSIINKPP